MKNFFRLEVFKDDNLVFDKLCPILLLSNIVRQWLSPELNYNIILTFDSGLVITSKNLYEILGAENLFNLPERVTAEQTNEE
jgi:hypothetical protein